LFRKSGLVNEESLASQDESDSVLGKVKRTLSIRFKDLLSSPKACGEELTVIKATKIKSTKYGDVYDMKSRPRGFCLIIDNQLFSVPDLSFRVGSRADADRLSDVFSQLGFSVFRYVNKNVAQMQTLLKELSQNPELANHDALAVIILSHGICDKIYGTDGLIAVEDILSLFNNINCRLMINKPKMFFLSACRGSKF
jgi:caspase 7